MKQRFAVPRVPARRIRLAVGIGLAVLTALVLLARLPGTVSRLNSTAKQNNSYTPLGRALAAADSFDIDNGFVVAAMNDVPPRSTFAILTPSAPQPEVSSETIGALTPFLEYLLLPSRLAPADDAAYLLCYGCAPSALPHGFVRIWTDGNGRSIGRVRGRP